MTNSPDFFLKVKDYVFQIFKNNQQESGFEHLERTVF